MLEQEDYLKIPEEEMAQEAPEAKSKSIIKEILSWVKMIVIAVILTLLLQNFVIINATIPTGSMISTMNIKDRVFAFRLSYLFKDPQRGEIIVFKAPDGKETLTKRIIGMPGDTVEIKRGQVYLNGSGTPLYEPYLTEPASGDFGPYTVPGDSYFMMGDNRDNSLDSRYWTNTYLSREDIFGKVVFKYYPKFEMLNLQVVGQ